MNEHQIESIPLRLAPVNVAVLLELTTEVMQRQAKALGISLTLHIDDDVPDSVRLDRDKVAWAITSLVGSAMRHVHPHGGSIQVHVDSDTDRSGITITVRDDGPGIPAERLNKLLHRQGWHPGSALALLLVEDIAIAHGGRVEIESADSRPEHFTLIRFTIRDDDGPKG